MRAGDYDLAIVERYSAQKAGCASLCLTDDHAKNPLFVYLNPHLCYGHWDGM